MGTVVRGSLRVGNSLGKGTETEHADQVAILGTSADGRRCQVFKSP